MRSFSSLDPPKFQIKAFNLKLQSIIVDALAESSSTLVTTGSEVVRKFPIVCSKATVVWNFPVGGANIKPALAASMASLVPVVVGHHIGELGLVMVLHTFIINGLKHPSLVINTSSVVSSSKHLIQED